MNVFDLIRHKVMEIPKGKVTTYGNIAKAVGISNSRVVGWAIYGNKNPAVPCHRVVKKDGCLAEKFSLGGWQEQKRRLENDGIVFTSEKQVDIKKYLWIPRENIKTV